MKNLTQSQQAIVDTLVAEFSNVNKLTNISGNIFLPLYDEAMADRNRIKEIEAMHKANKDAINLQIATDKNKYEQMFADLNIKLTNRYGRNTDWHLTSFDGNTIVKDYQGYNKLYWEYIIEKKSEHLLGEHRNYACGHHIIFCGYRDKPFSTIEQVCDSNLFKRFLKELNPELN